jgi:hypothetical protein
MSERRDAFPVERSLDRARDDARLAVAQARKRMIEAASRSIAVKWRSMRRGDRVGGLERDPTRGEQPPG